MGDVMFSHNGASGPESKKTRMFRRVCQVTASGRSMKVGKSTENRIAFVRLHPLRISIIIQYSAGSDGSVKPGLHLLRAPHPRDTEEKRTGQPNKSR